MMVIKKEYLGDGVFAEFRDYHVVLTAENGIGATDIIYLEPSVILAFQDYLARLAQTHGKSRDDRMSDS
ncbi:MAG: hypothetical protein WBQ19_01605 [Terriglobales bacterium]